MSRLIESVLPGSLDAGGHVVDDRWIAIAGVDQIDAIAPDVPLLVPHATWADARDRLLTRGAPLGVRLEAQDDPAALADDLSRLALIAIDFPKFTDGRGYSIARLLRERYDYRGSLRAVGDVLRDQLFYLLRCGFDSFAMKHDEHVDAALAAYRDFSEAYQTSVDRKLPWFTRRGTAPLQVAS